MTSPNLGQALKEFRNNNNIQSQDDQQVLDYNYCR